MSRLRQWFRARRWWTRTLIAAPLALAALAGLYLVARALQYRSASQASVSEFVPPEAQVVVRSTDAAAHWQRFVSGDFGRVVFTRMLRDAAVRREINALLKETDLPTLDDLEDRRFIERTGGMLTEDRILRFAGRDVMVALRLGDRAGGTRWCAATRLGFWDYAIAPFARFGLRRTDAGGTPCYRVGGLTVAIVGAVALASDDPALLASALRRRGPASAARRPVEATVTFERSSLLLDARRRINEFPAGALCLFVQGDTLARAHVTVDVDGADLLLEARLEGLQAVRAEPAPADAVPYVPELGAGAVLLNVGGDSLWEWARAVSEQPPRSELERMGQSMMREAVKVLTDGKFPERVPPRVRGPMTVLLGASKGLEQRTFASCAFVMRSDDATAAADGLRAVIQDLLKGAKGNVGVASRPLHGMDVWALDYGGDPFKYSDYLRPCWAAHGGALILANNLDFLMSVLTTAVTEERPMVSQAFFRAADTRLEKLGLSHVMRDGAVASGFVYGPALREGMEGFWPMLADKLTDNDANRRRLAVELEAEWRKAGRNPTGAEFIREFNDVLKERIAATERGLRDRMRVVDYVRWGAFEVTAEEGGLRLNAAVELLK